MLQWKGGQGWLTVEWLAGLCCTRGLCMCPLVMSGRYARVARPAEVRCGGAGGAAAIKGSSIAIDETSIAVASSAPATLRAYIILYSTYSHQRLLVLNGELMESDTPFGLYQRERIEDGINPPRGKRDAEKLEPAVLPVLISGMRWQ